MSSKIVQIIQLEKLGYFLKKKRVSCYGTQKGIHLKQVKSNRNEM